MVRNHSRHRLNHHLGCDCGVMAFRPFDEREPEVTCTPAKLMICSPRVCERNGTPTTRLLRPAQCAVRDTLKDGSKPAVGLFFVPEDASKAGPSSTRPRPRLATMREGFPGPRGRLASEWEDFLRPRGRRQLAREDSHRLRIRPRAFRHLVCRGIPLVSEIDRRVSILCDQPDPLRGKRREPTRVPQPVHAKPAPLISALESQS